VVFSFGSDTLKITNAGQSSGANLIHVLLAAPSVVSLFHLAILHSDPMVSKTCVFAIASNQLWQDYGFLSPSTHSKLQDYFNQQVNCSTKDILHATSLPLSIVLSALDMLFK
jgi:carboxylesterase type B